MKKLLCLLTSVMFAFSLSACGVTQKNTADKANENIDTENSVEKIYDDFIGGKITALNGDGSSITIENLKEQIPEKTLNYALFDRNGDSVPELCFNNGLYNTTFWISDGKLKLWREENPNMKILSNGNCLETHYGGAPNHTDYSYMVYSYSGEVECGVTISVLIKNDIVVLENIYCQNVCIPAEGEVPPQVEISKEQFDKTLAAIEAIGEAEISWKPIS